LTSRRRLCASFKSAAHYVYMTWGGKDVDDADTLIVISRNRRHEQRAC
jgi:hypothetical protein